MVLSEEVKNKIIEILDSEEFMDNLYIDAKGNPLDAKKRSALGQFYTPGKICTKMVEKFDFDSFEDKNVLDPTCGSGNLLIACLIAGADSQRLYGNEYDADVIPTCKNRINKAISLLNECSWLEISDRPEIKDWQIHQGNALQYRCLVDFSEEYSGLTGKKDAQKYNIKYINDLEYAQTEQSWRKENKAALERKKLKDQKEKELKLQKKKKAELKKIKETCIFDGKGEICTQSK